MKSERKVLVVGPAGRHLENHLNRIDDRGYEIAVLCSDPHFLNKRFKVFTADFSFKRWWNILLAPMRIRRAVSAYRPDVVHVHQANAFAFYTILGCVGMRLPLVLTLWGSDVMVVPKRNVILAWMARVAIRKAQVITADARFLAEEAKRLAKDTKAEVVICNFGVALPDSLPQKEDLVYSNRNHHSLYRIGRVIECFSHAVKAGLMKNHRLIIAGAGPQTQELKELAEALELDDHIDFVGFIDRRTNNDFYARARYFISLPESDGTAMSLLEAMAHGCIPVLSDLPANREWVSDGDNGILSEEGNLDGLMRASQLDASDVAQKNREIIRREATELESSRRFIYALDRAIELMNGA